MTNTPPPRIYADEKGTRTLLQLVLYRHDLRCAVAEARGKIGIPAPGLADGHSLTPADINAYYKLITADDLKRIRSLIVPPLSPAWNQVLKEVVVQNTATFGPLATYRSKESGDPQEYISFDGKLAGKVVFDYDDPDRPTALQITVLDKLSGDELKAFGAIVKELSHGLPTRLAWRGDDLSMLVEIADLKNQGYSDSKIASEIKPANPSKPYIYEDIAKKLNVCRQLGFLES